MTQRRQRAMQCYHIFFWYQWPRCKTIPIQTTPSLWYRPTLLAHSLILMTLYCNWFPVLCQKMRWIIASYMTDLVFIWIINIPNPRHQSAQTSFSILYFFQRHNLPFVMVYLIPHYFSYISLIHLRLMSPSFLNHLKHPLTFHSDSPSLFLSLFHHLPHFSFSSNTSLIPHSLTSSSCSVSIFIYPHLHPFFSIIPHYYFSICSVFLPFSLNLLCSTSHSSRIICTFSKQRCKLSPSLVYLL